MRQNWPQGRLELGEGVCGGTSSPITPGSPSGRACEGTAGGMTWGWPGCGRGAWGRQSLPGQTCLHLLPLPKWLPPWGRLSPLHLALTHLPCLRVPGSQPVPPWNSYSHRRHPAPHKSSPSPSETPSSSATSSPQRGLSFSRWRKLLRQLVTEASLPTIQHRKGAGCTWHRNGGTHHRERGIWHRKWGNPPQDVGNLTQEMGEPTTESGAWHRKWGNPPQEVRHLTQEVGEPTQEVGNLTQEVGNTPQEVGHLA